MLNTVFSGFIRAVIPRGESLAGPAALAEEAGVPYRHDEHVPRRFSGDASLPPGRFSTLCGPDGDDDGTLTGELSAYLSSESAEGHVEILDAGIPDQREVLEKSGMPGEPRIILRYYPFAQEAEREKPLVLSQTLEYNISEIAIKNVLDLRRPEAANWLCRTLTGLHLEVDNARLPCFNREPLDFFPQIIFSLLDQCRGGGNFHLIAGLYLRRLGIAGLVFPSARCDALVAFRSGEPFRWRNWSFVDYRDAPAPSLLGFYEERPHWPGALVREGGDGYSPSAVAFGNQVRIITTSYQEADGGFTVEGLADRTQAVYLAGSVEAGIKRRIPVTADRDTATFLEFLASMPVKEAIILARMTAMSLIGIKPAQSDLGFFIKNNELSSPVVDTLGKCGSPTAWAPLSDDAENDAIAYFSGLADGRGARE